MNDVGFYRINRFFNEYNKIDEIIGYMTFDYGIYNDCKPLSGREEEKKPVWMSYWFTTLEAEFRRPDALRIMRYSDSCGFWVPTLSIWNQRDTHGPIVCRRSPTIPRKEFFDILAVDFDFNNPLSKQKISQKSLEDFGMYLQMKEYL